MDQDNKVENTNDDESSSEYHNDDKPMILDIRFNQVLDGCYFKVILDIPYIHKEIAKENKCRFDGDIRKWYYNIKESKNFKNKDLLFNFDLYKIIGFKRLMMRLKNLKNNILVIKRDIEKD